MTVFSLAEFSKLTPRLDRAERELLQLETYFSRHKGALSEGDWGALSAVSLGVHNVYNGIEDILFSLARDIDGSVPTGPSLHQDILDQMAAVIAGQRPALLAAELHRDLTELKGFRHLVRHKYGFDLRPEKVVENADLLLRTFPAFVAAIVALEGLLAEQS